MDLLDHLTLPLKVSLSFIVWELFWYVLAAASVWLFFTFAFRTLFRHRRISREDPTAGQMRREFLRSVRSICIFGLVTFGLVLMARLGWSRMYHRVEEHGWAWFWISIGLMIVLHDTYFYWTHRLMHHRWLFRVFHRTHHLSTSPTPWAAYSFSTAEAFVQGGDRPGHRLHPAGASDGVCTVHALADHVQCAGPLRLRGAATLVPAFAGRLHTQHGHASRTAS